LGPPSPPRASDPWQKLQFALKIWWPRATTAGSAGGLTG
jgi:hypothetical protein